MPIYCSAFCHLSQMEDLNLQNKHVQTPILTLRLWADFFYDYSGITWNATLMVIANNLYLL